MRSLYPSRTQTTLRLIAGSLSVVVFVFAMPVAFAGQPGLDEPTVSGAGAQHQLRDAIATPDTAGDGVNTPGSPATRGVTSAPGARQVVESRVQLSQARDAAEASPRAESRTGGQQPRGIPDTSGQPANMPLMIGATIVLVIIGGSFFLWKKLSR